MSDRETNVVRSLEDARASRVRRDALDAGWAMPDAPMPPLSKIWIYSINHEGKIRTAGRLLHSAQTGFEAILERFRHLTRDEMASSAISMLEDYPFSDQKKRIALIALCCYFRNTAAWKRIDEEALSTGVHQIVVDWPNPKLPSRRVVRPAIAISPNMLTPENLSTAVEAVIDYESSREL